MEGSVFEDYNGDGDQDSLEPGLAGALVTAYDTAGAAQGSASSDANGDYSISAGGTGPYRLELTTLPSGYKMGPVGTQNLGSVRFAADGDHSGLDFGAVLPFNYCQEDAPLTTDLYQQGGVGINDEALITVPYTAGSNTGAKPAVDQPAYTTLAHTDDLGTAWGLAWQRSSRSIFASAFMKRHAEFGPDGTGAIYRSLADGSSTSVFLDINSLFGAGTAGINPHPAGTDFQRDANSWDPVGKIAWGDLDLSEDELTLWGISMADRQLYEMPLGSDPTNPVAPAAPDIRRWPQDTALGTDLADLAGLADDCPDPDVDIRPFGLGIRGGRVYVGLVCSAESSQAAADLHAFVYAFDPGSDSFGRVLDFPLDYPRGNAIRSSGSSFTPAEWHPWVTTFTADGPVFGNEYSYPQPMLSDIVFDGTDMILGLRDRFGDQTGYQQLRPSGTGLINGDSAGDLLRASLQPSGSWAIENNAGSNPAGDFGPSAGAGNAQGPGNGEFYYQDRFPVTTTAIHDEVGDGGLVQILGRPDVVMTQFDPVNASSTAFDSGIFWMNNADGTRSRAYRIKDGGSLDGGGSTSDYFGKANGVGDLEALCDLAPIELGNRVWMDTDGDGLQDPDEMGLESISVELWADTNGDDGPDTLVGTAVTDADGHFVFRGDDVADGDLTDPIGLVEGGIAFNTAFEIRVDGQQGGLSGKQLTQANAAQPANGGGSATDNDPGSDVADSDALGAPAAVISLTTAGVGDSNHGLDFGFEAADTATPTPTDTPVPTDTPIPTDTPTDEPTATPTDTPTATNTDEPTATPTDLPTLSLGNLAFKDLDNDGLYEPGDGEFGIDGVKLNLYVDDGDGQLDAGDGAPIDTTTTSGGGLYLFSGLAPGDYLVEVDLSNHVSGGPLEGMPSSTGNDPAPDPDDDVNNDDNGEPVAGFGVAAQAITLTVDGEPTNDGDTDANSNLSLDFGFINPPTPTPTATNTDEPTATPTDEPTATPTDEPTATPTDTPAPTDTPTPTETPLPSATPTNAPLLTLGNLVFKDLDNDGLFEPGDGEFGINAVLVNLYQDDGDGVLDAGDGAPIASQSTLGGGAYSFGGLNPGSYLVEVAAANFLAGGALEGMPSSTGNDPAPDPDDDVNNDDNGNPVAGFGVASAAIDLSAGGEPVNDGDADPNSNLTVDLGFWQPLCLGSQVFKDLDDDGLFEPGDGEFGIDGVTLNLYQDDGDNLLTVADGAPIAVTTTAGGGLYSFEDLTPGAYIVAVDPSAFAAGGPLENMPSSTGNDPAPDPDDDVDNDDNGYALVIGGGTVVATQAVILQAGAEPDKPVDGDGIHCNQTVDLGFTNPDPTPTPTPTDTPTATPTNTPTDTPTPTNTPQPQLLCLGDLVFFDLDNDGVFEPVNLEYPIAGVLLNLYLDDGDGVFDAGDGAPIDSTTSGAGGLYEFCNLQAGDYIVAIAASNFDPGEVLDGLQSSTGNDVAAMAPDPDDDVNDDDNGTQQVTGDVASKAVTLAAGTEPDVATDGDGTNSNHSVDFGLIKPSPPTGLLFGGLEVAAQGDGQTVAIRWQTKLEEDLLGFRVERSNFAGGPWTVIGGGKLIAAKEARSGASYAVTDRPGSIGRFYYRVVAVAADGTESRFGPAGITLGRWLPVVRFNRLFLPNLWR